MSPDKRKGEQPVRDAAEDETRERTRESVGGDIEQREEEGWTQPEASTQKAPPRPKERGRKQK